MDELARAIEATLFAASEPMTVEEISEHVGERDVAAALRGVVAETMLIAITLAFLSLWVLALRSRGVA
jgi:chromosome segregation and condensation protein ScpB